MSVSDGLFWLGVAFLIVHVLMDLRSMVLSVRHPKDMAWSVATVAVFIGHFITAHMGLG